jgi:hypothetical protein
MASGTTGSTCFLHFAVVAVDGVLGNHRLDVLGNVFDDTPAFAVAALHRTVTVRTAFEAMFDTPVNPGRLGPTSAGMSLPGPLAFAALGGVWLGVDRHHGRRRGLLLPTTLLQFGDAFTGGQQCQGDHLRSISVKLAGKRFVEFAARRSRDERFGGDRVGLPWPHAPPIAARSPGRK